MYPRLRLCLPGSARLRLCLTGCALAALLAGCQSTDDKTNAATSSSIDAAQRQAANQAEASFSYSDAVSIYQNLYIRHPEDISLGTGLARNLRFSGQPQDSITVINQMLGKNGRTVPLLLELGKSYLAADQDNLAVPTLLEAKGKEPGNWEVLSTLGVAYDYQADYADARDAYVQALIASPKNPSVLNNLALSQASSGDLEGAIATLQQAIDQPSALAQTRQNLALMLALKGNPDAADRLARKDLPSDVADNNMAYFKMIATAAKNAPAAAPVNPAPVSAPDSIAPVPATEAPTVR
jgi:Flp pilus assembly protein TadD